MTPKPSPAAHTAQAVLPAEVHPKASTGAQHAEITMSPLGVSVLYGTAEKAATVKSIQCRSVLVADQTHQL